MRRAVVLVALLVLACAGPARAARTVGLDAGDAVHVFVAGSDGALYHAPPGGVLERVGGEELAQEPVAVARTADGRLAVFARTTGGTLLRAVQTTPGAPLSALTPLGTDVAGPADVIADSGGKLAVFARGTDGAVWSAAETATGWSAWTSLGGAVAGEPAAVLDSTGLIVVYVRGTDGSLYRARQSATGFDPFASLTTPVAGDLAVVRTLSGSTLAFARGTDGKLLGQPIEGTPAAALDSTGVLQLFARGTDGALWQYPENGPWTSLGGSLTGDPAVIRDGGGRLHVVAPGANDEVFAIEQKNLTEWRDFGSLGRAVPAPPIPVPSVSPTPTPVPAPPLAIPAVRRIVVSLAFVTKQPGKASTSFKSLKVKDVPAGATVTATCETGCSRKSVIERNAYKTVSLERLIDRGALKAGTKIRVVVSMSRTIAAVQTLTVRPKRKPTVATRCLPPGATVESLCA